jgi:hypothetical protein
MGVLACPAVFVVGSHVNGSLDGISEEFNQNSPRKLQDE